MQVSPEIMNSIHSCCGYICSRVKQIMFHIMTCGMLSNYFVIYSLSNPKDKSNHDVIFMVCHVKYVNGLYYVHVCGS